MADKLATAFRLHLDTVQRLDDLVDNPPAWLNAVAPGPVENRTEVIERLVFLAVKHSHFGMPSDDRRSDETGKTKNSRKATKATK
jgi:hypothetical protein